jgi:hypothetical protein
MAFLAEGAVSTLAAKPLISDNAPGGRVPPFQLCDVRDKRRYIFAVCAQSNYRSVMPTEISIPAAADLKSRVRELRRFL